MSPESSNSISNSTSSSSSSYIREPESPRERVLRMLEERGVDKAGSLLPYDDDDVSAVEGAIQWWDERRKRSNVGSGLLVSCIREGGKPGYGQARSEASLPVTEKLLRSIRNQCLSPDGVRREEMLSLYEEPASRRGLTADELIDQAMGSVWQFTPPHPALIKEPGWLARYQTVIGEPLRPDVSAARHPGEDALVFCARFWRWEAPHA